MSVATIGMVVLTVFLGNWQHRRAEEKRVLAKEFDVRSSGSILSLPVSKANAGDLAFHRVSVRGRFDAAKSFFLDNKVHAGRVGYHVITPFRISSSPLYVLVDRGWVPAGPTRDVLPLLATPEGERTIEGIAAVPSARFIELAPDRGGAVRQNLVIARIESEARIELQPIVLEQTSDAADGLVRHWDRPDTGIERHIAYSLQWYSLAALAAVLYVLLNFRRSAGSGQR